MRTHEMGQRCPKKKPCVCRISICLCSINMGTNHWFNHFNNHLSQMKKIGVLVLFVIAVIEAIAIGFMNNKMKCDDLRRENLQMLSEEYPILVGNYEYIIKEYGISPDDSQVWSDIQVTKYRIDKLENGL